MARTIAEWIGRNDDAMPPRSVFDRLYEKQGGKDAITSLPFTPSDRIVRDHVVPLKDGGQNRESNLQLIAEKTHRLKTAREAQARAEERRIHERDRGYVRKVKSAFQTNRDGLYKKKMNGQLELRAKPTPNPRETAE